MSTRARDRSSDAVGRQSWLGGFLAGSGQIAVAMMVMNLATYGFTMSAARIIGPVSYGAFFAMMNLVIIISVVMLGIQATAARRISADPGHVGQIESEDTVVDVHDGGVSVQVGRRSREGCRPSA